jgi:uncharacterized membrane protein YagU involved in acid resistance
MLPVVTSCKFPVNPVTKPNPVYSHSYTWQQIFKSVRMFCNRLVYIVMLWNICCYGPVSGLVDESIGWIVPSSCVGCTTKKYSRRLYSDMGLALKGFMVHPYRCQERLKWTHCLFRWGFAVKIAFAFLILPTQFLLFSLSLTIIGETDGVVGSVPVNNFLLLLLN